MPYTQESDLKYINSLDDIPVSGDFDASTWTDQDKLDAAEDGESKLEADVNEGSEISAPEHIHGQAAATWATYRLVVGFKSPDSQTRGDALDEGSERMAFAEAIKEDYYEYVQSITGAASDESEGGQGSVDFMVADWLP
jgi:hypothetical protein